MSSQADITVDVVAGAKVDAAPAERPSIGLGNGVELTNNGSIYYNEANGAVQGHAVLVGADAVIVNNALIESRGTAYTGAPAIGIEATSGAVIDNTGTIVVDGVGPGYAVFTQNFGTVTNDGDITFKGQSGAAIYTQHNSTVTNDGQVSVETTGAGFAFGIVGPAIINNGDVSVVGRGDNANLTGLAANPDPNYTIENNGVIGVLAYGKGGAASGMSVGGGMSGVVILNSGDISVTALQQGTQATGINLESSKLKVVNTGTIYVDAGGTSRANGIAAYGNIIDGSDITNDTKGTIDVDHTGIILGANSKVLNKGEISAFTGVEMLDNAVVDNQGTISTDGGGIYVTGKADISNGGTIDAGYGAVWVGSLSKIDNKGTILSGEFGVFTGNNSSVLNSGLIDSGAFGIMVGSASAVENTETGRIEGGVYMNAFSSLKNDGELIANGAVVFLDIDSTVTNAGLIDGSQGITMFGKNTILNSGTIRGVILGTTANLIENSGVIDGGTEDQSTQDAIQLVANTSDSHGGNAVDNLGGQILSGSGHAIHIESKSNFVSNGGIRDGVPTGGLIDSTGSVNGIAGKDAIHIVGDSNVVELRSGSVLAADNGVLIDGDAGMVTNWAVIEAGENGIDVGNGHLVTNKAGAGIEAGNAGIVVGDNNEVGNAGLIVSDNLGIVAGNSNDQMHQFGAEKGIVNRGTIDARTIAMSVGDGNIVSNFGTLDAIEGIVASDSNVITNAGQIDAANSAVKADAGNIVANTADGRMDTKNWSILVGDHNDVINKGEIVSETGGIRVGAFNSEDIDGDGHAGVTNLGKIAAPVGIFVETGIVVGGATSNNLVTNGASGQITAHTGILVSSNLNHVVNQGSIDGDVFGIRVAGAQGNRVTNESGGTIAAGDDGINVLGDYSIIVNSGTVAGGNHGADDGGAPNDTQAFGVKLEGAGGHVSNVSGTVYSGTGHAIYVRGNGNVIENASAANGPAGLVDSTGDQTGIDGLDAISVEGLKNTLTNAGVLHGGRNGISVAGFGNSVSNTGTVEGGDIGIRVGAGNTVDNAGDVAGFTSGVEMGSQGLLNNTGSISGDIIGVSMGTEGATLKNAGDIQGVVVGVLLTGDNHGIQNDGSIEGATGVGVQGDDNAITNRGIITGKTSAIGASQGMVTITNSGNVQGDIALATGDDLIVMEDGGSITGDIDTAGGSDRITSSGNTTATGKIVNVETLAVTGGTLTLNTSEGSAIDATTVKGGTLQLDGTLETAATVEAGGTLGGNGTLTGTVTNTGTLAPGASIGTLTIDGSYVQTATGSLFVELGATSADKLVVTGAATLDGVLSTGLVAADLATLQGKSYSVLTAGSISGEFDATGTVQQGFWTLNVQQTGTTVTVTVVDIDLTIGASVPFTSALAGAIGKATPAQQSLSASLEVTGGGVVIEGQSNTLPVAEQEATSLSYDSMGDWENKAAAYTGSLDDLGGRTPASSMPKTGGAQFQGTTKGELTETASGAPEAFVVEGNVVLSADFASGLVNANFTGMEKVDADGVASAWVDFRARMSIADGTSEFAGTAGTDDGVWNGEAKGGFFDDEGGMPGHAAGLWSISSPLGRALGGFTAKRQ